MLSPLATETQPPPANPTPLPLPPYTTATTTLYHYHYHPIPLPLPLPLPLPPYMLILYATTTLYHYQSSKPASPYLPYPPYASHPSTPKPLLTLLVMVSEYLRWPTFTYSNICPSYSQYQVPLLHTTSLYVSITLCLFFTLHSFTATSYCRTPHTNTTASVHHTP